MSKTKIAIIIVCYNGRDYLPDCLNSLKKQSLEPDQIIIVDNASTDQSVDYISENFPDFKLIKNKKNQGFAQSNNQGIDFALKNNPDFIFLLNQDTICDQDCLEQLANTARKGKKIFAYQPLILCWPEKNQIQTSGDKMHFLGFGYSEDYKKLITENQKLKTSITYASGAAMFINVQALKEVGLLDHDLFMYHEDLDLCLRARFLGYDIVLVPQAIIYHKYQEGIPKHRWYWSERNRLLTLLKFYKFKPLILIFPAWLFMEMGVLFYSLMTGCFSLKIKSYFSVLYYLPKTLRKRKRIQKSRKITDQELSQYLESKFDFAGFTHPLLKYIVNPIFGFSWKILKKSIWW